MRPQAHYQTCLASCLLTIAAPAYTVEEEYACFNAALPESKEDYVSGHLQYITTHYDVRVRRIIENAAFFRMLKPANTNIRYEQRIVTPKLIASLPKPLILYIDHYVLTGGAHSLHFIIIDESARNDTYHIRDPWDGSERELPRSVVEDGVRLFREHLRFSPQVIMIEKEKK